MQHSKEILTSLRSKGYRLTKARQSIIEVLEERRAPLSIAELRLHLKKRKIAADKTTVYRELDTLVREGLVSQVQLGDGVAKFECAFEPHHHHLICTNCATVEDVPLENDVSTLVNSIQRTKRFRITNHSLEFFGLCLACQ